MVKKKQQVLYIMFKNRLLTNLKLFIYNSLSAIIWTSNIIIEPRRPSWYRFDRTIETTFQSPIDRFHMSSSIELIAMVNMTKATFKTIYINCEFE